MSWTERRNFKTRTEAACLAASIAELDAKPPTLRELAERAIAADDRLNSDMHDAFWNEANARAIAAKDELQQRLFEVSGLTPALLGQLAAKGII